MTGRSYLKDKSAVLGRGGESDRKRGVYLKDRVGVPGKGVAMAERGLLI